MNVPFSSNGEESARVGGQAGREGGRPRAKDPSGSADFWFGGLTDGPAS